MATADETYWKGLIAKLPCLICSRFEPTGQRTAVHHIATGSSKRSHFAVAPLCHEHHQGALGFHGPRGTKWFLKFYRVPWEMEEGMLAWTNMDLAKFLRGSATKN
jgi:hypothetical protein